METAAFREVVEANQAMVYRIALRITCDIATAEEVAQDAFLALYRNPAAVTGEDHLRFWLRRVATHGAIDALRRRGRQPESGAEEWMEDRHASAGEGSGAAQVSAGLEARIEELLRTLPEPMRVAVVLRYCESLSPPEIAEVLAQPVATVKSNLQRGLALLRRKAEVSLKEYVRD